MAKKDKVRVRMLVDHAIDGVAYRSNDVVYIAVEKAKAYAGLVDAAPEAVAYCMTELGAQVRTHDDETAEGESAGKDEASGKDDAAKSATAAK